MDDYSIIQTVAKVAESFNKGELFNFFYDGIEVRRGKKGYVSISGKFLDLNFI
ncbi:hypothetical protein [Saccharolobus islandicus]|uniref:Uncharacterized protein n=1 Tax=Saccharolobus islandicus (strain REY15A) TaxID=930945 RepID=F0NBJ9_SACI5|nr:hypothetical protein [Sulfolobus islandicus]ADX85536.1 hypothetical protein SiRe_1471 [Sulfolobus islandicus REY15A]